MPHNLREKVITALHDFQIQQQQVAAAQKDEGTTSIFQGLSPESLQFLLAHSHTRDYAPQEQIVAQGDQVSSLYLILQGQVKTVRLNDSGAEATIRLLRTGETFMDAVLFMGGPSPIGAVALEATTVLRVPADIVKIHILQDPQFSANMLRIVTAHYKNAIQQIDSIVTKAPVERLGYYLLRQHLEQGVDKLDIDLSFQKAMIANQLGMTPETFSRALAQIKKMGIDVEQKHIHLKDSFSLCNFCDWETMNICDGASDPDCPNAENCLLRGRC